MGSVRHLKFYKANSNIAMSDPGPIYSTLIPAVMEARLPDG